MVALFSVSILGFLVVGARLVQVQAVQSDRFVALAAEQRERRVVLSAQRGSIYDRDLADLALSINRKTIYADPRLVRDPAKAAVALAPLLGQEVAVLQARLETDGRFVYLARKADPQVAKAVLELQLSGIGTVDEPQRFYPAGDLAAQVLGFVGVDNEGLAGMESLYDDILAGRAGEMLLERDPSGRPIPAGRFQYRPPIPGDDLILTIDREIQYAAEQALKRAVKKWSAVAAMAIVMDPRTGELLAVANLPTYDPNRAAASDGEHRRNRALTSLYEPGSVNKLITAAAALETGAVSPGTVINVPDRWRLANKTFRDWKSHPTWDLTFQQVIEFSSNVGTIKTAARVGKEDLHRYLVKFGYGQPTGLNFPGEPSGLLLHPDDWWSNSLGTIAIGQGVAATPLQVVAAYAAVANGGVAVQPRLLKARVDSEGNIDTAPDPARRRVVEEETAATLMRILLGVTENEFGTGKAARVDGYQIAGKTATAQIPRTDGRGYSDAILGSFIGSAPAGDPQVVVGVMLEDPKPSWGGFTAGSTFKEIMQFTLRHLGIGPGPVLPDVEGTPLPAPGRSGSAAADS